jgi:hypothetical protein
MNSLRQKGGFEVWRKYNGLFKAFFVSGGAIFSVLIFHAAVSNLRTMRLFTTQVMPRMGDDQLMRNIEAGIRSDMYWIVASAVVLCICAVASWRSFCGRGRT